MFSKAVAEKAKKKRLLEQKKKSLNLNQKIECFCLKADHKELEIEFMYMPNVNTRKPEL